MIPHGVLLFLALTLATLAMEAPRSRAADPAVDGAWTLIPASLPPPRTGAMVTYDSRRHRLVLFGGYGSNISYAETWVLDMADPQAWELLPVKGDDPLGRGFGAAVYDSLHDRLMIFGGGNHTGAAYSYAAQLWFADAPGDSSVWDFFTPAIAPGGDRPQARYGNTAIYDPVRQEMVMYGGTTPAGANIESIWALTLDAVPTWYLRTAYGPESIGSNRAQSGYDPRRRRMVVYGGYYRVNWQWTEWIDGAAAWNLDTFDWTALFPPTSYDCPTPVGVDPARDRLLRIQAVYGCMPDSTIFTFNFEAGDADTLKPDPPIPSSPDKLVFDPVENSMWIVESPSLQPWTLSWPGISGVGEWPKEADRPAVLGNPRPNPASGRVNLPLRLDAAASLQLVILDLQGRCVRRLWEGSTGAGRFDVAWNLRDDSGTRVAPGVYFARLTAGGVNESRRIVVTGE